MIGKKVGHVQKSVKRGRALKEHVQLKEDVQACQDCSLENICSYFPTTQDKATYIKDSLVPTEKVVSTISDNCVIPPSFDLKLDKAVSYFLDVTLVLPLVSASIHNEPVQVHSTSTSEAFVAPLADSPKNNADSNTNVIADRDTSVDLEASVNLEKLSKGFREADEQELQLMSEGGIRYSNDVNKWARHRFDEWKTLNSLPMDLTIEELYKTNLKCLVDMLAMFFAQVQKKDGILYPAETYVWIIGL